MTLRTLPIPDPAPGVDWSTVVPGKYLYDVTGITATLTTFGADPTVCVDASGSGSDLTYTPAKVAFGIPGYVEVDYMAQWIAAGAGFIATGAIDSAFLTGNDLFLVAWTDATIAVGSGPPMISFVGDVGSGLQFFLTPVGGGMVRAGLQWQNTGGGGASLILSDPIAPGRHMFGVRFDLGALKLQYYLDGAPWGAFTSIIGTAPNLDLTGTLGIGGIMTSGAHFSYDEVMLGGNLSVDADFANLYALRTDFALYTNAALAMGPEMYYHLDDTLPGTGRQVVLDVTVFPADLAQFGTGFPVVATSGPYRYSWQPGLTASSQTPDGTLTTVAIPRLIVPAGYVIGARTLDLDPSDQWSDITLWWDDTFMGSLADVSPYVYPPGVKLEYHREGVTP